MDRHNIAPIIIKKNIRFGFRVTWIWPLNPKAMDENFGLAEVYTIEPTNMEEANNPIQI